MGQAAGKCRDSRPCEKQVFSGKDIRALDKADKLFRDLNWNTGKHYGNLSRNVNNTTALRMAIVGVLAGTLIAVQYLPDNMLPLPLQRKHEGSVNKVVNK